MSWMKFTQRLVALAPWPRLHLIRFRGPRVPQAAPASGAAGAARAISSVERRMRTRSSCERH